MHEYLHYERVEEQWLYVYILKNGWHSYTMYIYKKNAKKNDEKFTLYNYCNIYIIQKLTVIIQNNTPDCIN